MVKLVLIAVVLLMSVSVGNSQSSTNSTPASEQSERERLVTKTDLAIQEVIKSREYIPELERQLKATEELLAEAEKAATLDQSLITSLKAERDELRESIKALKAANAERLKEIGKMQKKINDLQNKVSFWRKVALTTGGILAAGAAAVVLLN